MRMTLLAALLLQVSGVLSGPDPAQMEKAPDLGYMAVQHSLTLPDGLKWGAASSVAFNSAGHMFVFNRGASPLVEFDQHGAFVRVLGEGRYTRPHGMKIDREDNIWTTDVNGHTVTKMNPHGDVVLTLGVKGQPGAWDEASNTRLLNEPTDLAFGPSGELFVVEGHGRGEGRVLKFDKTGKFIKSWGGNGTGQGQFNQPHAIAVDAKGTVYVADRENRRVEVFDADGKYIKEWKFAGLPCGFFLSRDGQLYMTSGFAGQILKLDSNGKALAATGQPGKGLGEFGEAHYMAMAPNGDIYVADTINAVLHKFVRKGTTKS
jgi:DNA-binding beta-propeller fold protein YncE